MVVSVPGDNILTLQELKLLIWLLADLAFEVTYATLGLTKTYIRSKE